jgi:hypothetical protein
LTEPLSESEKDDEWRLFSCYILRYLKSRVPPGYDAVAYARMAAHFYRPPHFASGRIGARKGAEVAALRSIIPLWRETYLDEVKRKQALDDLLQQHQSKCPNIHEVLTGMPSDKQWVYLLVFFRDFGPRYAAMITGFSVGKVTRLSVKAKKAIQQDRFA